jgi:hypothetical protein
LQNFSSLFPLLLLLQKGFVCNSHEFRTKQVIKHYSGHQAFQSKVTGKSTSPYLAFAVEALLYPS